MNWVLDRLKERSTWVGIFALLATFGIFNLEPERAGALATALSAVIGTILIFLPDKKTVPGGEFNPDAPVRRAEKAGSGEQGAGSREQGGRGGLRKG